MSVLKLERGIENRTNEWARARGWLAHKVKFGDAGYPDRLYVNLYGYYVWIEFKRPGKEPEDIQYHRMEQMRQRGMDVTWTDNYSDAIGYLYAREHLRSPRLSTSSDNPSTEPG